MSAAEAWIRLTLRLSAGEEDAVLTWMQEQGALGAQGDVSGPSFQVYFPAERAVEPLREALGQALGRAPDLQVDGVADGRWEQVYYQGLSPFALGERFLVHPGDPPDARRNDHRHALWIPPGRAFGTGDHATTRLCVAFLERRVRPGQHVLDVGTGTGILAMAAAVLGASRVVAVDVDREAVEVARENLRRNGLGRRVELVLGTTAAVASGWFDLLTANLRSDTLVDTMADLAHLLRPGGAGVLSGILAAEAEAVEAAALGRGLEVAGRSTSGEWVGLELAKPA